MLREATACRGCCDNTGDDDDGEDKDDDEDDVCDGERGVVGCRWLLPTTIAITTTCPASLSFFFPTTSQDPYTIKGVAPWKNKNKKEQGTIKRGCRRRRFC